MKNYATLYHKYIIKSPILFYTFLILFIGLFLFMSLIIELDIVRTVHVNISDYDNYISFYSEYNIISDTVFLYKDRNDLVHQLKIEYIEFRDDKMLVFLNNTTDLYGEINIDIITGKQTLLEKIFIRGGGR